MVAEQAGVKPQSEGLWLCDQVCGWNLGEEGRGRASTHRVFIWDDKPKLGRVESGAGEQGERLLSVA